MIILLVSATLAAAAPATHAAPMAAAPMDHAQMAGMDHAKVAEAKPKECCCDKMGKASKPADPAHQH